MNTDEIITLLENVINEVKEEILVKEEMLDNYQEKLEE